MTAGEVVSLHLIESAGGAPLPVVEVRAVPGRGLEGDRYFTGVGTFSGKPGPHREITLIEEETLLDLRRRGIDLSPGGHRRNLVTRGVRLNDLVGTEFRIGDVALNGVRLCDPCAHLESLSRPGVHEALKGRGGLRAQILTEGSIRRGDPVSVAPAVPSRTPAPPPA